MVRFGKQFANACSELTALVPELATWPRIDYKYHKVVLYEVLTRATGSKPPLLIRTDITGEEPMIDSAVDDEAFCRALLSDIVDVTDGADGSASLTKEQRRVAANRAVTGVLASTAAARDVKFDSFSVAVGGKQLVSDCHLELTQGCRYGLLGDNGSGKSNILDRVASRGGQVNGEEVLRQHHHRRHPLAAAAPLDAGLGVTTRCCTRAWR